VTVVHPASVYGVRRRYCSASQRRVTTPFQQRRRLGDLPPTTVAMPHALPIVTCHGPVMIWQAANDPRAVCTANGIEIKSLSGESLYHRRPAVCTVPESTLSTKVTLAVSPVTV
jgi:hypothetical protein